MHALALAGKLQQPGEARAHARPRTGCSGSPRTPETRSCEPLWSQTQLTVSPRLTVSVAADTSKPQLTTCTPVGVGVGASVGIIVGAVVGAAVSGGSSSRAQVRSHDSPGWPEDGK